MSPRLLGDQRKDAGHAQEQLAPHTDTSCLAVGKLLQMCCTNIYNSLRSPFVFVCLSKPVVATGREEGDPRPYSEVPVMLQAHSPEEYHN